MATTEQWKRFVANEPEAQRELRTIELWHPDFDRVYRFVNDYNDLIATLEDSAPRNPDQAVLFTAATLSIEEPAERNDTDQILSVSFGATDSQAQDIIEQITGQGYLSQVQVVYRKYYSADLTMPAVPPLYLYASGVNFENGTTATLTVEDTDLTVKRSGVIYTTEFFPGLAR